VYTLGECIGEGGMARVYQAEHAGLRRQVALKVLLDGFGHDPDGRERFVREARIAAAIKHPNVVNIFDVGVQEDIPYMVMEFLEGQDLEKLLEAKGPLEESLIVDIMVPVVAGLLAVHDAGIVHRDLKPGNIFLARGRYNDVEPKLLDFGISHAQGIERLQLTANHSIMGTPFYISPEAVRGGEMTPLSDQYSLGVVMYECVTGVTPFRASSLLELSSAIGSGKYTPPAIHKPGLSPRLERIIEHAMSLNPENRFKDMREMGCELLTLAGQRTRITWGLSFTDGGSIGDTKIIATSPKPPSDLSELTPPGADRARKIRMPALVAGMALLLVIAGFVARPFSTRPISDGVLAPMPSGAIQPRSVVASGDSVADTPRPSEPAKPFDGVARPAPLVQVAPGATGGDDDRNSPSSHRMPMRRGRTATLPGRQPVRAGEMEPEWSLPPARGPSSPAVPDTLQFGANNAPILD
jgi:hypothetical protein